MEILIPTGQIEGKRDAAPNITDGFVQMHGRTGFEKTNKKIKLQGRGTCGGL